jgi:hypothetical protein
MAQSSKFHTSTRFIVLPLLVYSPADIENALQVWALWLIGHRFAKQIN